jgi:arylsulfatase A-like enzyme
VTRPILDVRRPTRSHGRPGLVPALLAAAVGLGCGGGVAPDANLVLVTVDTLRPDRMSAYGYERETSPRLDAFAREGARFELAYAPMSATLPSHATIFTGQYPISHGVVKNGVPLPAENEMLAEILRDFGYQTAAFVSSFVLDRRFGLDQGFERYDDDFTGADPSMVESRWEGYEVEIFDRRAEHTTRDAAHWLETQRSDAPFFLFVHYFDPHAPYAPPGEASLRFHEAGVGQRTAWRNLYDAEVAYLDTHLGTLLDALDRLGLAADTLVVITSDHGEGLWDHGAQMHGVQIYEEQVRVPLLVRWPGRIPPGRVIEAPVGLIDIAPTLLDLLGIGVGSRRLAGSSLAAALERETRLPQRAIHAHREPYEPGEVDGVRVAGEQDNRYYEEPEVARRLHQRISAWRETHAGPRLWHGFAEEDREALEALGYVG